MIRLADLRSWRAISEPGKWTVREDFAGAHVLLIASGTEENMRIVGVAPKALSLLARALKDGAIKDQKHVNEASAILDVAGVQWR